MYLWSDYLFNMYSCDYESFECDFVATNNKVEFSGRAKIKKGYDDIEVIGSIADCKIISDIFENTFTINANDIPQYYELILSNLPKENLKDDVKGEIEIKFPKTRVCPTFQINMDYDWTTFDGKIQPLYSNQNEKIMEIRIA